VNAHGTISLGGLTYAVGASYAGEPVEAVVTGGLVDIVHAGVVIATHAQRFRPDQADLAPRARITRWARDATAGLTVAPGLLTWCENRCEVVLENELRLSRFPRSET